MRNRWYVLLCLLMLGLFPQLSLAAAPSVTIASVTSSAGQNAVVNISLANNGNTPKASTIVLEVAFDASKFSATPTAAVGTAASAAGKSISANVNGGVMSIALSGGDTAVGDGIIAALTFPVKADVAQGTTIPITFNAPPDISDPDTNTVTVTTVNGAITIPAGPDVTINSAPAAFVKVADATFTFTATNATSTECKLDTGAFAVCTSPKSYTGLPEGSHTFTVQAKNSTTSQTSAPKTSSWIVDTTKPALTVNALTNGTSTNTNPLNINGTVTDANGMDAPATLTINGNAPATFNSTTGSFSSALNFTAQGATLITTTATDKAGNVTTDARTITYDNVAPILTVTAPADNSQTNAAELTVTGTINETSTVAIKNVTTNTTVQATVTGTGFSGKIQLVAGANSIEITATDTATNKSPTVGRTVTLDTVKPALAITVPAQDLWLKISADTPQTISGTVTEATLVSLSLTFNGQTFTLTPAATFTQAITVPGTADKEYQVVVTATDSAGNVSTVIRNINVTLHLGDTSNPPDDATAQLPEILLASQYVFNKSTLTDAQKSRLDCAPLGSDGKPSPNGVVDSFDLILLLSRFVGAVSWQ